MFFSLTEFAETAFIGKSASIKVLVFIKPLALLLLNFFYTLFDFFIKGHDLISLSLSAYETIYKIKTLPFKYIQSLKESIFIHRIYPLGLQEFLEHPGYLLPFDLVEAGKHIDHFGYHGVEQKDLPFAGEGFVKQ